MKKRWISFLICAAVLVLSAMPALADDFYGADGWSVSFTEGREMVSNFRSNELNEAVAGLQPGDSILFHLELANRNEAVTDWYMNNRVLYSLEDRSANAATAGGAYTYQLIYYNTVGEERVLFSSDTVGGEHVSAAGEGLHAATNALTDFFYLDTLGQGQSGTITLRVALDGETQGNDYQDTLADLAMSFAVELEPPGANERLPEVVHVSDDTVITVPSTTHVPGPAPTPRPWEENPTQTHTIVKTGDERNLTVPYVVMGISGILFLVLAIDSVRRRREDRKGGGR